MISESMVVKKFKGFADTAMPLLFIKNKESYNDALHLIELLLEKVGDDETKAEQHLINILGDAIAIYESKQNETIRFLHDVKNKNRETGILRTLIEQHHLKLHEFPEIGDKSLVSKILSGERQLTKNHIKKLSDRFKIDPGLFF